jgi:hypothetical protein
VQTQAGLIQGQGLEVGVLTEGAEEGRRRVVALQLELERSASVLVRARGEKEALDCVRRSLEAELDRSRYIIYTYIHTYICMYIYIYICTYIHNIYIHILIIHNT